LIPATKYVPAGKRSQREGYQNVMSDSVPVPDGNATCSEVQNRRSKKKKKKSRTLKQIGKKKKRKMPVYRRSTPLTRKL
jgi:hypothetical protein